VHEFSKTPPRLRSGAGRTESSRSSISSACTTSEVSSPLSTWLSSPSALSRVVRPPHSFSTAIPSAVHSAKTTCTARVKTDAASCMPTWPTCDAAPSSLSRECFLAQLARG
jgi:hypothetical protein